MTVIVDAGPVITAGDDADTRSLVVREAMRSEIGPLVLPSPVSAEVDYLMGQRLGRSARRSFLEDLADGRFNVASLDPEEYSVALQLDQQYHDLDLGLADVSIIVLARRFRTRRILTFDYRCFRAVRPLQGGAFTLLPADAADQGTHPLS